MHLRVLPSLFQLLLVASFLHISVIICWAIENCVNPLATVVSIQGDAAVKRHSQTEWNSIGFDESIYRGDSLRVGKNSRVSILLAGEGLLRLDQFTTLHLPEPETDNSFLINLVQGVVHFFSHKPRHMKILTPFVNGIVEGTEFVVNTNGKWAEISVLQGHVRAKNQLGELLLSSGQTARAQADSAPVYRTQVLPEDAVQWALYYPIVSDYHSVDLEGIDDINLDSRLKNALIAYRQGDLAASLTALETLSDDVGNAHFYTFRAGLSLLVGRVAQALDDIEHALRLKPDHIEALALKSVVAVTKNRKKEALALGQKAVAADVHSANAHIALSYAQQADFQIGAALASVETAVTLAPENAVAWSRLAELQLSHGELDATLAAASKAIGLNPQNAHAQTVLGFAYLTQIKIVPAMEAFQRAISLDQAAPLPRLGLGLATINGGDLVEGRRQIEISASLDARNALIRSYLGKAYFDEKRDNLASDQYAMAKALDPQDPTAWLYDALLKQANNRPVEALRDLQQSIALNDNRAVYRSRLLLDEDLAARSAGLARIFNDLGFQQLALVEGWKSVNTDQANFSAHRFLADSYAARPRHEIARVSELLQSQLLQPINFTPIQPQLTESSLGIVEGVSLSDSSFNEFGTLFNRNRLTLQADGVAGGNGTLGNDLVLSGLYGINSFSIGQFHYETDGFRENNGQDKNIFNTFYQVAPWHHTSFLVEVRSEESRFGDLPMRFDPKTFYPDDHNREESDSIRLGMRHAFAPQSTVIATAVFEDSEARLTNEISGNHFNSATEGYMVEGEHLYNSDRINLLTGFSYLHADDQFTLTYYPDQPVMIDSIFRHETIYFYSLIDFPRNLTWTIGGSVDSYKGDENKDQFNPKVGLSWNPIPSTTLRAAAFRILNKTAIGDQTIEPTQVSGFNQYFKDIQGDDIWRYGVALDQRFSGNLFSGIELSTRDIKTSYLDFDLTRQATDWTEELARVYLNWAPLNWLSINLEYQLERFDRALDNTGEEEVLELKTQKIPIRLKTFCPYGITAELKTTLVDQHGIFADSDSSVTENGEERFWTTDVSFSYHFPKRQVTLSFEVKNAFDKEFQFQSMEKTHPEFTPERFSIVKVKMSF
jgi:tetratricopeptide (TPR) repeat protein